MYIYTGPQKSFTVMKGVHKNIDEDKHSHQPSRLPEIGRDSDNTQICHVRGTATQRGLFFSPRSAAFLHVEPDHDLGSFAMVGERVVVPTSPDPPLASLCLVRADQDEYVRGVSQGREPADGDLGDADLVDAVHEVSAHLGRTDCLARLVERGEFAVHPEREGRCPSCDEEGREGRQDQERAFGA